jgi:hypothetical protein
MAKEAGISQHSVRRIWQAFGLKPHLVKSFKLSTDPMFVEKVRDFVGLYLNPPEKAIELCVDEESQTQALQRTQPILPMGPGRPEPQKPRLLPPGHRFTLHCLRRGHRTSDRQMPQPSPGRGIPQNS